MNSVDSTKSIHQLRKEFMQKLSEVIEIDWADECEEDDFWPDEPVRVLYASLYSQEMLGLDDEDLAEFIANVDAGKTAVVVGHDENAPQWLIICFDDCFEVFNIHKLTLESCEDTE